MFTLLAASLAGLNASAALAQAPFSFETTPGQLPKDIIPSSYELMLTPDLKTHQFRAQLTIHLRVENPTQRIVLNAVDLEILSAQLEGQGSPQTLTPDASSAPQTLSFSLNAPLAVGAYDLRLEYSGKINPQPQGLYFTRYPTSHGEDELLATHFEPTDARRLLPCWDEPAFRAKFTLAVNAPQAYSVYSNMPVENITPLGTGIQRVAFQPTPPMPSYLLALVVGHLERIESTQDGVKIGVVTTVGKHAMAAYALQASKDLLHYYNDYFGIRYPLPKLDHLAIPGGFDGATENWGAITYTESLLLFNPQSTPEHVKTSIYASVAHEMAHQWFGNLVTTAWWDHLWLNEGFASWMGTKAVDHFNPNWHVWLRAGDEREMAMDFDSHASTHPIQQHISNENQAFDAFDDITYLKAQAVLHMLERWLGADAFRAGIHDYLTEHRYSNATTTDLWNALERNSHLPVRKVAQSWIEQPGFPLITVEHHCENNSLLVDLTQHRYRTDNPNRVAFNEGLHTNSDQADRTPTWKIPISAVALGPSMRAANGSPAPPLNFLLDQSQQTLSRADCQTVWLLDPEGIGYYRVAYPPADLETIATQFQSLPDTVRLKLLSDTWSLAKTGQVPLSVYLNLIGQLGNENQNAIWSQVNLAILTLDQMAEDDPIRIQFRPAMINVLKPQLARLGWNPKPFESNDTRQLRAMIIGTLGRLGDVETITEAQARFKQFLTNPKSLPPSLSEVIINLSGRYADADTWNSLHQLLDTAPTLDERSRYLQALCRVQNPALAAKTLELSLDHKLPLALSIRIPELVANAGEHLHLAWSFVKRHGNSLLNNLSVRERNHFFSRTVASADDAAIADDLLSYSHETLPSEAQAESQNSAETIRVHAADKAMLLPQLSHSLRTSNTGLRPGA